jgi:hypothetical protein
MRRIVEEPKKDAKELFRRVCFNALISNIDDHPRNHAIIAKEKNWKLSPAYDLTPSTPVSLERRDLALGRRPRCVHCCGSRGSPFDDIRKAFVHPMPMYQTEVDQYSSDKWNHELRSDTQHALLRTARRRLIYGPEEGDSR